MNFSIYFRIIDIIEFPINYVFTVMMYAKESGIQLAETPMSVRSNVSDMHRIKTYRTT